MTRIVIADDRPRRLAFFLALEEWIARNMPDDEYIFDWNVNPTVIIGRNQDLKAEVNLDFCLANNIEIVRRRSGGGCVYADRDNIMFSYVSPGTNVSEIFARYTSMMARQLVKLGFDAEPSGRNDITIGERKISGNAYYMLNDRSIVHGTMLYDTNIRNMLHAITPSKAKLESHKVKSVEARIITARQLKPDMAFETFKRGLLDGLATKIYTLSDSDLLEVIDIERDYYRPGWLEGRHSEEH